MFARHVFIDCGVAICGAPHVGRDWLSFVGYPDGYRRIANHHFFLHVRGGDAVEMALKFEMIIDVDVRQLVFTDHKLTGRKRSQSW